MGFPGGEGEGEGGRRKRKGEGREGKGGRGEGIRGICMYSYIGMVYIYIVFEKGYGGDELKEVKWSKVKESKVK